MWGYVNSPNMTLREMEELTQAIESFNLYQTECNALETKLDEYTEIIKSLNTARNVIQTHGATEAVIATLDGFDGGFTAALESWGLCSSSSKEDIVATIDKQIEAAQEGFVETIKNFIKKILEWIAGLFSMNQRMLNLFNKAAKMYDPKKIDAKHFETIKLNNGLKIEDFNSLGKVIMAFDSTVSPHLSKWLGMTSMISIKDIIEGNEKKINDACNAIVAMGQGIKGLSKHGPKGLVKIETTDKDTDFTFDYSVIGEVDKTTKELGFTPVILDACIDNSAKVLINVNRYSAGLQTSSKTFSKFFDGMSKSLAAQGDKNTSSVLNQLSGHLKTFVTANKFIQTGSQIMSRMVYTMLKNARVVNDGKQDAIDAEAVTFGRLLLGNSN